jgi:hypothetical protein
MNNRRKQDYYWGAILLLASMLACNFPTSLSARVENLTPLSTPVSTPVRTSIPSVIIPAAPTETATQQAITDWQLTVDEVLATCPTADEVADIDSKIRMSFESDPTVGKLVCRAVTRSVDLTRLQRNAYNAILVMKHIEFDAPLPWTDMPLYDWFLNTISAIRFRDDISNHSCCGTPPTINIKTELQALYSDRWTAVGKLTSLYVHEARHTYAAHTCNGKDTSIAEMGALGVEYSFYRWLAYHSDLDFMTTLDPGPTDDYRQAARWNAYAMEKSSFCKDPTPGALPAPLAISDWTSTPVVTNRTAAAMHSNIPIPVLLSPAGKATVPVRGGTFTWEPVDYPGEITYNIEIDAFFRFGQDWQFWEAREDERGLSSPVYSLAMPFDSYDVSGRWRVWATSAAAGDGLKSEWRYFEIGPR